MVKSLRMITCTTTNGPLGVDEYSEDNETLHNARQQLLALAHAVPGVKFKACDASQHTADVGVGIVDGVWDPATCIRLNFLDQFIPFDDSDGYM